MSSLVYNVSRAVVLTHFLTALNDHVGQDCFERQDNAATRAS